MNLRKDHYRTSLTVVKHCVREFVFAVRVCTEKWDFSASGARCGAVPNPKLCTFHRVVGVPAPTRLLAGWARARTHLLCDGSKSGFLLRPTMHNLFPFTRKPTRKSKFGRRQRRRSSLRRSTCARCCRDMQTGETKVQLLAVDHSAHVSMKSGASSVN